MRTNIVAALVALVMLVPAAAVANTKAEQCFALMGDVLYTYDASPLFSAYDGDGTLETGSANAINQHGIAFMRYVDKGCDVEELMESIITMMVPSENLARAYTDRRIYLKADMSLPEQFCRIVHYELKNILYQAPRGFGAKNDADSKRYTIAKMHREWVKELPLCQELMRQTTYY